MYAVLKIIATVLMRLLFRVRHHGNRRASLPDGGVLICSNHRHWLDPVIISCFYPEIVHWVAKKELFSRKFASFIMRSCHAMAIDRENTDMRSLMMIVKKLQSGSTVGIFPEGTRVKEGEQVEAKPGVALLANKGDATIFPVYIKSQYRMFSRVDIYWGDPFSLPKVDGRMTSAVYAEMANLILDRINQLEE